MQNDEVCILVCEGCHNTWVLKTSEICVKFWMLGVQNQGVEGPLNVLGGDPYLPLWLLVAASSPCYALVGSCITPVCLCH